MEPSIQSRILDEFSEANVPLHYTEFWADNKHLLAAGVDPGVADEMRAEYVANVMTVAFAHPAVESFYFWGELTRSFRFKSDHNTDGLPSSSHTPSAVYWRVQELLQKEWMTRETLVSDGEGRVRFKGFFGDYALRYAISSHMPAGVTFVLSPDTSGLSRHLII